MAIAYSQTPLTQFIKFGAVGLIGTAVNLTALFICVSLLGLSPYLGAAVAIELSIVNNFLLNDTFTFGGPKSGSDVQASAWRRFIRFNLVALSGAGINYLFFALFYRQLHLYYLAAAGLAILAAFSWNYAMSIRFVWKKTAEPIASGLPTAED